MIDDPIPPTTPATEQHFTVPQVAKLWGVSASTVRRLFEDMPEVLKISMPKLMQRKHRPHVRLFIPLSVLESQHSQWSAGFEMRSSSNRPRTEL